MKRFIPYTDFKIILITIFLFIDFQSLYCGGEIPGSDNNGSVRIPKYSLEDLVFNLNSSLSPSNHLWVMSGWTTVTPLCNTVMGTGECIGMPLAGMDFRLLMTILANNHRIPDTGSTGKGDVGLLYSGGKWQPDRLIRFGTYHYIVDNELISFSVRCDLIPLFNRTGFLLKIILKNRTGNLMKIKLIPDVNPGCPSVNPLNNWTYVRPPKGESAKSAGTNRWSNGSVEIKLIAASDYAEIPSGKSDIFLLAVLFTTPNEKTDLSVGIEGWEKETVDAWNKRLARMLTNIPVVTSDIPGLDDFYKRSLVSGLVCIWENPAFVVNPYISTLGIDGGGMCAYIWDIGGYIPRIITLMTGEKIVDYAEIIKSVDLERFYAYTLDGSGVGVSYSYSIWSFVNLVWNIWKMTGPQSELYEEAKRLVLDNEKRQFSGNGLIDFGSQLNLLEMRSAGWEHFVASPNAERAWCLERLADMAERIGCDGESVTKWRRDANEIRLKIRAVLWNPEKKWFDALYPDGHRETVFSIQAYDAMRAGVCTEQMENDLVSHLREGAFLFPYGISSISAEDEEHYEVNDTDWSGGGIYIGNGAEIAMTMYESGRSELGFDILKRFFWLGRHLPYYPQEHYVDRPAVPAHKRANEISGLTGAQTILYGMAGIDHRLDGSLWIDPHFPKGSSVSVAGYGWKNNTIDLLYNKDQIRISLNGREVYSGVQKKIRIL